MTIYNIPSQYVTQAIHEIERRHGGCWEVMEYGSYDHHDYNLPERWDFYNYAYRF